MARPKKQTLTDLRPATPKARTAIHLPAPLLAYITWRATINGIPRDTLLAQLLTEAHAQDPDPKRPPIN